MLRRKDVGGKHRRHAGFAGGTWPKGGVPEAAGTGFSSLR